MMKRIVTILAIVTFLAGCQRMDHVGRAPSFNPLEGTHQHHAMYSTPHSDRLDTRSGAATASLWTASQRSLLGERRAGRPGDILTVVIEINESAEISNSSGRSRNGSESMGLSDFFGIPQRVDEQLPGGASMGNAVGANSAGSFRGEGSVRRNERLTLRIAVTVVETLPNGVLHIEGSQEVRVNNELRELVLSGYIRPEDISRQNEITYDKIAGARISYGGRGQISDVQQPRIGQQIVDILLPF